jgi:nicotinamide mononucleotide adenylyltransferase
LNEKVEVCLISGRFDRPHTGHIRTIQLLGQRFNKVLVVVLNYREQKYSAQYRAQVLREILENCKGTYEVVINNYHFAAISIDELLKYEFDVYAAGNFEVLKHIEQIYNTSPSAREKRKIRTIWIDRPYGYDASTERLGQTLKDMK